MSSPSSSSAVLPSFSELYRRGLTPASQDEASKVGDCPICYCAFDVAQESSALQEAPSDDGPAVKTTACGHIFHLVCIQTWTDEQNKLTCPCCRRQMYEDPRAMLRDLEEMVSRLDETFVPSEPLSDEFFTNMLLEELHNRDLAAARDMGAAEEDVEAVAQSLAGNGPGFW